MNDSPAADQRADSPSDGSFADFAAGLAGGDRDAAARLLERYSGRLVALARMRLGPRLAGKVDAEDVFQSVLRTFFRRLGNGGVELRDWSSLSGLLAVLTLRKCRHEARRYGSARRDVRREVPLPVAGDDDEVAVPDREPTPEEVATFVELLTSLLDSLSDRDRQVLEGVLAGETGVAVARALGCSQRTVYRTLARIEVQLLRRGYGEDRDPAT